MAGEIASNPPAPPKPRPSGKPKPLPNLTAEKKSGKAALNTFAELAAFFKKEDPKPDVPPRPSEEPMLPVPAAPMPKRQANSHPASRNSTGEKALRDLTALSRVQWVDGAHVGRWQLGPQ